IFRHSSQPAIGSGSAVTVIWSRWPHVVDIGPPSWSCQTNATGDTTLSAASRPARAESGARARCSRLTDARGCPILRRRPLPPDLPRGGTMATATTEPIAISEHEAEQVERANATSSTPVVFVHGLWLLPSSWDRWAALFEEAGYVALAPGW